uniref:U32-theraphotoxin-Cg1a n=1 Tax=Chilobrachys guangxiensis TaxID=278060 RepID=TX32E_CHIGU|nr:RecName: Full=U32-theraphotoxin-Cg1a; Short=U32-TRTX-Cg1a; AltName: Full=Jingzhaotoxin-66.2; Short=JZTX-66.2; AltName: Full=Peptide F8-12.07; Flags: Precursor [Chilobrachys guangxiensis]ABY71736.1 cystine knot toxin [Chilobrachys guangxiensis]
MKHCFLILFTLIVFTVVWSLEENEEYPDEDEMIESFMDGYSYRGDDGTCILKGDHCHGTCDCCGWTTTCRKSKSAGGKICKSEGSSISAFNAIAKGVAAMKKAKCKHKSG